MTVVTRPGHRPTWYDEPAKDWVELHDDLVLTDDSLLMADLPPLSDEEFAQLQLADDPGEFLKEYAGRKLFVDLPSALIERHPHPKRF